MAEQHEGAAAFLASDRGAQDWAGGVGHMATSPDSSVLCRCGNLGCLAAHAGGAALARDSDIRLQLHRFPHP